MSGCRFDGGYLLRTLLIRRGVLVILCFELAPKLFFSALEFSTLGGQLGLAFPCLSLLGFPFFCLPFPAFGERLFLSPLLFLLLQFVLSYLLLESLEACLSCLPLTCKLILGSRITRAAPLVTGTKT